MLGTEVNNMNVLKVFGISFTSISWTDFFIYLTVLAAIMLIVYIVVKQPVVKGIFYALFVFVVSFECLFIIPQLALFVAIALVPFRSSKMRA